MKASFSSKIKFNKDLRKQYFSLLLINQFSTKVPLPYPLKISETLWFTDVFRRYRSGTLVENGLISVLNVNDLCIQ